MLKIILLSILIVSLTTTPAPAQYAAAKTSRVYPKEVKELTDADVKALYAEFKNTIVSPLAPNTISNIKDYKIDNAEEYLKKTTALHAKINDLLLSSSEESIKKYGDLLWLMRDLLYADASNLKLLIDGKFAEDLDAGGLKLVIGDKLNRDAAWYDLHNRWLSWAESIYNKLFK